MFGEVEKFQPTDLNHYLEVSNRAFNGNISWRTLQKKSETGPWGRSERGYQQVFALVAGTTARELGLSQNKTELFVKMLGAFFPQYGSEGKKCIREFLQEKGMEISEPALAAEFFDIDMNDSWSAAACGLDAVVMELFSDEKNSGENEFELAKLYHDIGEILKVSHRISWDNYHETMDFYKKNALSQIKANGIYGYRQIIRNTLASLNQEKWFELSSEEKEKYKASIQRWCNSFGQYGVSKFITNESDPCEKLKRA